MPRSLDYLRPLSERQLRRRALRDQALSVSPLAKLIGRRASAGAANIEGVTGRLAANLAGYQQRQADIYGRARTTLEGVQGQGAQQLGEQGGAIGSDLARQLELSGQAQAGAGYGTDLARLQTAQATRGRGELGELALRQAAAEDFAAKLPGFARLAGQQGIAQLQAQRQRETAELSAQAQSRLAQSLSSARRQEYEKAVAARGFGVDYAKIAQQERKAAREAAARRRKAAETERHNLTEEERKEKARRDANRKARRDREQREGQSRRTARTKGTGGRTSLVP